MRKTLLISSIAVMGVRSGDGLRARMSNRRGGGRSVPKRRFARGLPFVVASLACLAVGMASTSSPAVASPTCAAGSPNTTTVTPSEGSTSYTVPVSGVSELQVVAQGGQGAATSGTFNGVEGKAGGDGAVVTTDLAVSSSEVLTVAAGGAANDGTAGETGDVSGGAEGGSGGPAGIVSSGSVQTGGGGAGSTVYDGPTLLVAAGGGGGAGYGGGGGSAAANSGSQSAGAVTSGGNGADSGDGTDEGGVGGSSTPGTGGAGTASGSAGSGMEGGAGGVSGYGGAGGGGGGYAGGGGGGSGPFAGGGGAGSSYSVAAYTVSGGTGAGSVTLSWEDPAITSANSITFTVGTPGSFTVCTTGVPTDAISAGSGFPAWATFTDNHDGTATISGTPPSNSAGGYPFTITASNGNGTAATQPFTLSVTPATPSISTSQQPASAVAGSSIADEATVTGGYNPSGTVTFNLYSNSNGTGLLFTDANVPLSGGTATSTGYTATATGTDYWVATYNGDSNNNTVTSPSAAEPVTITPPPCTAGYFSPSGDAPCTAASPGYYVSGSGAKSQSACPLGYYQPSSGASSCDEATPGHYVSMTGSSSQSACAAGYYQPNSGASSCIAAAIGYFVATSGQASEVACPAGETTLVVASTACVAPTTLTAAGVDKTPGLTVFSARLNLTLNGKGVGGQTIVFKIGPATICTGVTAANGAATCAGLITLNQYLTATTYTANYAGNPPYLPSSATGSFYIAPPVLNIP